MTRSSDPGPDHRGALTPWERRILAEIEDDLTTGDPRLAREMRSRRTRSAVRWWPVSGLCTALLVVALLVLVLAGTLLRTSSWAVLALVTTLVVVPWLLLAATEKNRFG
jgi:hypothetical protein